MTRADLLGLAQVGYLVLMIMGIGFVLAVVACMILMPLLRRFQALQRPYEDAPETHQAKAGTPTMGGLCFVVALIPIAFVGDSYYIQLFGLVSGCALIGFIDDLLAIRLGRNRGLRARTKYLFTALVAIMFLRALDGSDAIFPRDVIFMAGTYALHVPHWLWLLVGIAAVTGTIHAVNLTDGLDGLAAGAILPPFLVVGIIGAQYVHGSWIPLALAAGACVAFLIYNRHPARLIMGDTGSLALGALLSGVAIITGEMLLLVVVGGVFVAEALSVMLQVVYFKVTHGKRIFKMSPLHHHFELSGWPETKVTVRFWVASAICSAVGLAIVR